MEARIKIYLAEPDTGVVRFLRTAVEPLGYKVQEAMDWGQIPAEAALFGARLVLVSTEIPGVYFGDILRQIKGNAETKALPLLVLVAANDPRNIRDSLEQGADDFVLKPLVLADVTNKLKLHLRAPPPPPPPVSKPLRESPKAPPTPESPRVLQAIADVADAISSSIPTEDAFYVLAKRTVAIAGGERCSLALKGTGLDEAFLVAVSDNPDVRHQKVDFHRHPGWKKALQGVDAVIPEGDGDWLLPILARETAVGLLCLEKWRAAPGLDKEGTRLLLRVMSNMASALVKATDALENVKYRSVEEKAPAEEFDNIVLDLNDQIEVLIEELESK